MFGFLKKKATRVAVVLNKKEHAPVARAIVAAGVLVAAADGSIDDSELETLRSVISNNATLAPFVPEAGEWTAEFTNLIKSSPRTGKLEVMRVIEAVRGERKDAENVLVAALDIAEADGDVPAVEQKVLEQIASTLGLRLADIQ